MKVGIAFSDHIKTEKFSRRHLHDGDASSFASRYRLFLLPLLLGIAVFLLLIRIVNLQIFQGTYYRTLADGNRIRTHIIHAPRGVIFDRNNVPLIFNIPGFREVIKRKTVLLDQNDALQRIAKGEQNVEIDSLRQYPFRESMGHILGYIGQITKEELLKSEFADYGVDDLVGRMGIEQSYESSLRGIDGKELLEVDAMGKTIRVLGKTDPIPGLNIHLTIDATLQKAAYESMREVKLGALIVSKPDGELLAMISKPSFDPNLFTQGARYHVASDAAYTSIDTVLGDTTRQPLLNRAIGGAYPPGSTFKIITAAAGLETKTIDDQFQVEDTGVITIGPFSFANWYYTQYGKKDGMINVVTALQRSNDIFFYKLAEKVGVDTLSSVAKTFGLGKTLGIDIAGEVPGLVPTKEWKEKTLGESWYLGDTYHYGIGQGFLLTTPFQVNSLTQVIANSGSRYEPHLLESQKSKVKSQNFLKKETTDLIRQGMIEACSPPRGVAWPLFDFKVKNSKLAIDGKNILASPEATTSADFKDYRKVVVACKTGTAQHGGEDTLPHAWVTLFAPAYNPQIVVTVLSESSGEGSSIAAPIAKKVLENWFTR